MVQVEFSQSQQVLVNESVEDPALKRILNVSEIVKLSKSSLSLIHIMDEHGYGEENDSSEQDCKEVPHVIECLHYKSRILGSRLCGSETFQHLDPENYCDVRGRQTKRFNGNPTKLAW